MLIQQSTLHLLRAAKPDLSAMGIRRIGLFGSFARNQQNEQGDIDISVDFDPEHEKFDNPVAAADLPEQMLRPARVSIIPLFGMW